MTVFKFLQAVCALLGMALTVIFLGSAVAAFLGYGGEPIRWCFAALASAVFTIAFLSAV